MLLSLQLPSACVLSVQHIVAQSRGETVLSLFTLKSHAVSLTLLWLVWVLVPLIMKGITGKCVYPG